MISRTSFRGVWFYIQKGEVETKAYAKPNEWNGMNVTRLSTNLQVQTYEYVCINLKRGSDSCS